MSVHTATARDLVDNWTAQLKQFLDRIAATAEPAGWHAVWSTVNIKEDPFSLGVALPYEAPVLILHRPDVHSGSEQKITFEPRHRFTMGAAGRVDVYSYPALREAMLLRTPGKIDVDQLTLAEAEDLVAGAPWKAFSQERLPLRVDLSDENSVRQFLEDLAV